MTAPIKQQTGPGGTSFMIPDASVGDYGMAGPPLKIRGASAGPGPAETFPDEAYLDPVLNEDVRKDTECVVLLVVELDQQLGKH